VTAHEVQAHVEQVHRAALALRAAGGLPVELRHHRARGYAARERLAVLAVGADHVVVGAERGERAHRQRLLADVEVTEAADLPEAVRLARLLLEVADQEHLAEPSPVPVRGRLVDDGRPARLRCRACHQG
jgi:hypothetical protein